MEDVDDVREALARLLRVEGADVIATSSGREAIEKAADLDFDVLLTDLGLPDIPGEMVIREILARARRRPRIVVVTAFDEPYTAEAREAGADVVLTKPVPWQTLVASLQAD